jgi:hypothetical protein
MAVGGLLLAWMAAQLIVARSFGPTGAALSAVGVVLLIFGWLEVNRDRVGQAVHALDAGYELIAVGARGAGWSTFMGSAASSLAHNSVVPVLIVDDHHAVLPSS